LKRTVGRGGHVPGELEQALAHGIAIEGLVTAENKGGFDVQIGAVRAFCPGSQIDRRRGETTAYVGQRLRFRVIRIEAGGRNIVVSRRALLEEEAADQAAQTWDRIQVGAVLQGRVSSVQDFGAFVDLGEVEGLIHVSELGHGRVSHPGEVLEAGQIVEVKVIKVEPGDGGNRARIGLSMRALAPDPWMSTRDSRSARSCRRRRRLRARAFVEIAPGHGNCTTQADLERRIAIRGRSLRSAIACRSRSWRSTGAAPHQPVDGRTGPPRARRAGRARTGRRAGGARPGERAAEPGHTGPAGRLKRRPDPK
jgi:small subunit ribosomal protein S1